MSVAISLVRALVDAVERAGVEPRVFLERADFDSDKLDDPHARVDLPHYDRLQTLALEMTDDPALGLHMGEHASMSAFNLVGVLTTQCRTIRDCMDVLMRYYRIVSDIREPRLIEQGSHAELIYEYPRTSLLCNRMRAEFGMTRVLMFSRIFTHDDALPDEVWFEHSAPAYVEEYRRIFGGRARFDCPHTGMRFERSWLDSEQRYADAQLYGVLKQQADQMLRQLEMGEHVGDRIHQLIVHHYHEVRPDMETIARRLGMSKRSLRRKLAAEGQSFSAITHSAMGELACNVLREPSTTIQEAAYRLGFAEVSSFHRAFKRWTGQTPRQYRAAQGLLEGDA